MGKGTPSMGRRQKTLHLRCRRCGRATYHKKKSVCSSCGFGKTATIRKYSWQKKKIKSRETR